MIKFYWPSIFLIIILFFFFVQKEEALSLEKIDINLAKKEELEKIIGIGPATAKKIIETRKSCYFYPLSSLSIINGIGPVTIEKIEKEGKAFTSPPEDKNLILCQEPILPFEKDSEKEILKIDINSACSEELTNISGIGETRAKEIISQRPFFSLEELTNISGIGEKTLEKIKEQGLAWVDPILEKKPLLEKKVLAAKTEENNKKEKSFPLSSSLFLALFFSSLVLFLKKNLNEKLE
jgi:competence ComEA-like helix-hairpin-helix protein